MTELFKFNGVDNIQERWKTFTSSCRQFIQETLSTLLEFYKIYYKKNILVRVGFLPWQKLFLPGQWKKPVKLW